MGFILNLEDFALYTVVKNFERLTENQKFMEVLKENKIPALISNKIFNYLNKYHCGIFHKNLLKFKSNYFQLTDIRLTDRNLQKNEVFEVLREHKIFSFHIESTGVYPVDNLLDLLNGEILTNLTVNNGHFEPESKIIRKIVKRKRKSSIYNYKLIKEYLPLTNVIRLNLSGSNASNIHFFHMTRRMKLLENLNVSGTAITDIRLMKNFPRLEYLDCSRLPKEEEKYIIHLHSLSKLKYIQFGNSKQWNSDITYTDYVVPAIKTLMMDDPVAYKEYIRLPERFGDKTSWSFSEFFEMGDWKDLKFLCHLGDIVPNKDSVV